MSLADDAHAFLFLVPYVARRRRGVPVDELAQHLSITPAELVALLDRVAAVGMPDGTPDEMVEIYLEGDRVHVALPQGFEKPPRFTVEETLALLLVLAPLRESALPELSKSASRLSERLLALSSERAKALSTTLREAVTVLPTGDERPEHLEALERAVAERRAVEIEYYTASRDAFGARTIRPWALFPHRGAWYVLSDERKTFKVARMRKVALMEERFPAPRDQDLAPYLGPNPFDGGGGGPPPTTVELEGPDGPMRVPGPLDAGMRAFLRSRRGAFVLHAPAEEREPFLAEVRTLLERYAPPTKQS